MNIPSLLDFHWATWLLWALVVTQLTIFSVTVYLHRAQAHRALDVRPALAHVIRCWLWLTTGMSTQQWVAVHRKHHAHCETEQDPHSPQVLGLKKVFFLGARLYAKEASNPQTVARYATGAPNDWLERNVYTRASTLGPVILALLNWGIWGLGAGTAMSLVQFLWIPLWAAGVINGVGHFKGYRNFDSGDASRNLVPWGIWIGGEELHNNHHAHPTSAKLSYHWWEVDIGWGAIQVLQALGLAKVKKAIRAPKLGAPHQNVNQTWQAALQFRGQLERWFAQAWASEARRVAGTAEQRKEWLRARAAHLRAPGAAPAADPLPATLAQLQQQWRQLQVLWNEKGLSQEQALNSLSAWLEEAQRSSLASVQRIAWRMQRLA